MSNVSNNNEQGKEEVEMYDARMIPVEDKFDLHRRWRNHPNFHKLNATQAKALWVIWDMLEGSHQGETRTRGTNFLECWFNNASLASELGHNCKDWRYLGKKGSEVATQLAELGFIARSRGEGRQKVWPLVHTKEKPPALRLRREHIESVSPTQGTEDVPPEEDVPHAGDEAVTPERENAATPEEEHAATPERDTDQINRNRSEQTEAQGTDQSVCSELSSSLQDEATDDSIDEVVQKQGNKEDAFVEDTEACSKEDDLAMDTGACQDAALAENASVACSDPGADQVSASQPSDEESMDVFLQTYRGGLNLCKQTLRKYTEHSDDGDLDRLFTDLAHKLQQAYGIKEAQRLFPKILRDAEINAYARRHSFNAAKHIGFLIKTLKNDGAISPDVFSNITNTRYSEFFEENMMKAFQLTSYEHMVEGQQDKYDRNLLGSIHEGPIGKKENEIRQNMNKTKLDDQPSNTRKFNGQVLPDKEEKKKKEAPVKRSPEEELDAIIYPDEGKENGSIPEADDYIDDYMEVDPYDLRKSFFNQVRDEAEDLEFDFSDLYDLGQENFAKIAAILHAENDRHKSKKKRSDND